MRRLAFALLLLGAAGCSAPLEPAAFESVAPRFEPERFFEGRTRSWGVVENRAGEPTSRFETSAFGRREGEELVITQDFTFDDGRRQQRVWRLRRLDEHRYEATANDVVGTATGEARGNAFRWQYTLALEPGNAVKDVDLLQWMYAQEDGSVMVNRATISKLGVILAEVTEFFRRLP